MHVHKHNTRHISYWIFLIFFGPIGLGLAIFSTIILYQDGYNFGMVFMGFIGYLFTVATIFLIKGIISPIYYESNFDETSISWKESKKADNTIARQDIKLIEINNTENESIIIYSSTNTYKLKYPIALFGDLETFNSNLEKLEYQTKYKI